MRIAALTLALAALGVTTIASAQNRLPRECRQEIVKLCGTDRSQIRSCLREKLNELSETCQSELRSRFQARRNSRGTDTRMSATPQPVSTTIIINHGAMHHQQFLRECRWLSLYRCNQYIGEHLKVGFANVIQ